MIVARWSIDARFGYQSMVAEMMQRWMREIGSQIGWSEDKARLFTASISSHESMVQSEIQIRDLAELEAAWSKLATIEAHKRWGKEIEPYVVSGSPRWEILRVVE